MSNLQTIGQQAQASAQTLSLLSASEKNHLLAAMANALEKATETILAANQQDLAAAKAKGTSQTMLDRLLLTEQRITEMANGIREVAQLPDPIGAVDKMWRNADDLLIGQQRVPLGVIGIIYEGRGMGEGLKKEVDQMLTIPMTGHVQSLNASVAAGLLMYQAFTSRNGASQ